MFCESCGNPLPDDAKFCTVCGAKTDHASEGRAQPAYTAPPIQQPAMQSAAAPMAASSAPMSVGQFIGMFLLLCIPIVNIILLFIWAFGSSTNLNKKNYARATLILMAISVVLWILAGGVIMGIFRGMMGSYY
jgi:uncharacterized membrane protein YvbJ